MIGRGAAIAEVGKRHHEIHGELAHMAWLGVHASLMTGTRAKIEAFVDWAWDGFTKTGGPHVLDRGDAAEINWDDDPDGHLVGSGPDHHDQRLIDGAARYGKRPGPLAVRDHDDLSLLLRPGDDRAGVPGRDPPDGLVPHRQPRLQADDPLLRDAAADQRGHRRGHRAGPGVPVRDELVDLLALRRRRVRGAAGDGGDPRVLPRVDVPGAVAVRLGPAAQAGSPRVHLGGFGRARCCRRCSSSSPTPGCSIRSATRSTARARPC